jgi:hypothetical protein
MMASLLAANTLVLLLKLARFSCGEHAQSRRRTEEALGR